MRVSSERIILFGFVEIHRPPEGGVGWGYENREALAFELVERFREATFKRSLRMTCGDVMCQKLSVPGRQEETPLLWHGWAEYCTLRTGHGCPLHGLNTSRQICTSSSSCRMGSVSSTIVHDLAHVSWVGSVLRRS